MNCSAEAVCRKELSQLRQSKEAETAQKTSTASSAFCCQQNVCFLGIVISTTICSDAILSLLDSAIGGRRLSQISAIGVGNFCESRFNGSSQVALLLILMEHFKCDVRFREPFITPNEKEWLNSKGVQVERCSDLLERLFVDEKDESAMCLCYMPHCGHALYNSVIYAHRDACDIRRLIIFGNNLQDMQIAKSHANELDAICEYRKYCETISVPPFDEVPSAFNDTAIHFLKSDSTIPKIPDRIPQYDYYASEIVINSSEL
ncbi:unnamed protein product [Toxocara canis]|uniref:SRR1 domain-containing protein n=1 Tax=Toxocara canis TaxID=6265 RepID=A0A183UPR2_TOXCA|nr:unnamed protein product [Toxocara canis]